MSSFYTVRRPRSVPGVVEMVSGEVAGSTGGHPPHWHSEWQLVAVTRGDGWVRSGGAEHRTPGGSLFLIPPEVVHSNDVFAHGCAFRSMLLDGKVVEEIAEAAGLDLQRQRIQAAPVLCSNVMTSRLDQFHEAMRKGGAGLRLEDALNECITELFGELTAQCANERRQVIHPAARLAREYLWSHAEENFSLQDLSREAGMSRFELIRVFRAAYGMPPHAWQLQVRVERGKELLKKGYPAGETALQLGFCDQAHFGRVFKKVTGYTPARFRSEFRNIIQDP